MKTKLAAATFLAMAFSGCGGGGGGGGGDPTATPSASPGGLWKGKITYTEDGSSADAVGMITETGEGMFLVEDGSFVTTSIRTTGSSYSGTGVSYAPEGWEYENGLTYVNGTIAGTIIERTLFSGRTTIDGETASNYSFEYSPLYDRDSSLSTVSGTYSYSNDLGIGSFSVDSAGRLTGSDTDGCMFNGSIQIINPNFNIYRINMTVSNCEDTNGSYRGLATLDDSDPQTNDSLLVILDGSNYVFANELIKN